MHETIIYISVTRGIETLILDGKLHLFGELLTTLNDAARQLIRADSHHYEVSSIDDPKQEGSHVTG